MFETIKDWMKRQKTIRIKTMGHVPPPPPKARPVSLQKSRERRARKENPAVKDAWEKYQITLKLVIGEENEPTKFGKRTYNTGPK